MENDFSKIVELLEQVEEDYRKITSTAASALEGGGSSPQEALQHIRAIARSRLGFRRE